MTDKGNLKSRRERLLAMREKFRRDEEPDFGEGVDQEDDAPAFGGRLQGGRRRKGLMGGRGAGRGKRGAMQQGQGGPMQRIYQFLTEEGPGASFVEGTNIRKDRLKQAIQFLKQRSRLADGKQGQKLNRAIQILTQETPDAQMVAGVNIDRLNMLFERLGQGGGMGAQQAEIDQEYTEEDYVEVDEAEEGSEAVAQTLQQLVGITARLSAQLDETQKKVDQLTHGKAGKDKKTGAVSDEDDADGEDWFTEYLE